jgi:murein L,D-transpeptidase YafK
MKKQIIKLLSILLVTIINCNAIEKADKVIVNKTKSKLYLLKDGKVFRTYSVAFGGDPKGHKMQEGDQKTPEGNYILDYKNINSSFYKSIHISYPNKNDIEIAKQNHVSPGGYIMIHGQRNGYEILTFIMQFFNWTAGCIAVTNSQMDEIWDSITLNTPIEILP